MNGCMDTSKNISNEGYLITQGGGNSLKWIGVDETVKTIPQGVNGIQNMKKV